MKTITRVRIHIRGKWASIHEHEYLTDIRKRSTRSSAGMITEGGSGRKKSITKGKGNLGGGMFKEDPVLCFDTQLGKGKKLQKILEKQNGHERTINCRPEVGWFNPPR